MWPSADFPASLTWSCWSGQSSFSKTDKDRDNWPWSFLFTWCKFFALHSNQSTSVFISLLTCLKSAFNSDEFGSRCSDPHSPFPFVPGSLLPSLSNPRFRNSSSRADWVLLRPQFLATAFQDDDNGLHEISIQSPTRGRASHLEMVRGRKIWYGSKRIEVAA